MWTEKYRPSNYQEFIGGAAAIKKIKGWFQEFREGKNKKKVLLLSGPSGVGKTTLAYAAFREENYNIVECNCNNIHDIKEMREVVGKAAGHANILDLFQGKVKPAGVLIDEVDNIPNGMSEFITLIKSKDVTSPIICTCNDITNRNIKSLKLQSEEIKITKPTKFEMEQLIKKICLDEHINLEFDTYYLIIPNTQGDWRRLIQILFTLKSTYGDQIIDIDKVKECLSNMTLKDVNYQLSETVNRIFNKNMSIIDSQKLFMMDCYMVPLLTQQNYPKAVIFKKNNPKDLVDKLTTISGYMAEYDRISTCIYQTQNWHLNKYAGLYSITLVNHTLNTNNDKAQFYGIESSTLFNRISQYRRNVKSINYLPLTLQTHLSYMDLYILSDFLAYHLFDKKGRLEYVIQMLLKLGFQLEEEDGNDGKGKKFTLEALNSILSINYNKTKKLTSKLKLDLKEIYQTTSSSSSVSSS